MGGGPISYGERNAFSEFVTELSECCWLEHRQTW